MSYTVQENPVPGTEGVSTITIIEDDLRTSFLQFQNTPRANPRLIELPYYYVVEEGSTSSTIVNPPAPTPIVINTQVQNQSSTLSSRYIHTGTISNISTRTLITNNGLGVETFEDIAPVIWSTSNNKILVYAQKEIIELQIQMTVTTDTLGGAFEVDLESVSSSKILNRQEFNINIQEQDYTITSKVVTTLDDLQEGIELYIKPELGMILNLTNIEFIFIKTTQL